MGRKREIREILEKDMAIKAINFRKQGWSYDEIAHELGLDPKKIFNLIQASLSKLDIELSDQALELREMILQRIETAMDAIFPEVEKGNFEAIQTMLKLNDQAAVLLGVKVNRHDVTSKGEMVSSAEQLSVLAQRAKEELRDWHSDGEVED